MSDRRVLMIAYHYPPVRVSSGIQRTLKFSQYLREHDWEPMILTVSPKAYESVSDDQMKEIPPGLVVERAFGLDTARHLSVKGRYLRWMAQPDRWVSWWPAGVIKGLGLIRKYRPKAIFSTFPIATAHLIALTLHRLSGLPLIVDFRDAMTEPGYPTNPVTWGVHRRLEKALIKHCTHAIFTTTGTRDMYAERYPDKPANCWAVIENGFDEDNFRDAESGLDTSSRLGPAGQMVLIHSGLLYPEERDPKPFFAALRDMKNAGEISPDSLHVILRATGSDDYYHKLLSEHRIDDIVSIQPTIAYRSALQEMMRADGLLLLQGASCNKQIPAKLYEYARAGKPIIALTDFDGSTAALMKKLDVPWVADIADASAIRRLLNEAIRLWQARQLEGVPRALSDTCSRRARTAELAQLLDALPE
ncbi:MAG: glycosyltransferase [Proteobacteria bacterium]|nr:glycosyltransferase [Pseudomonadota bacterium]